MIKTSVNTGCANNGTADDLYHSERPLSQDCTISRGVTGIVVRQTTLDLSSSGRRVHKAEALDIAKATTIDFLGRPFPPVRNLDWAVVQDGDVTGWVSADPWGFLIYRDTASLQERAAVGAVLDYPFFAVHQPGLAKLLIESALGDLERYGCTQVFLELPVDSHAPRGVVDSLGFRLAGFEEDPPRRVFCRRLLPPHPRRSLFPYAAGARVRSSATACDAPTPNLRFWQLATLYSGFSAYPVIDQFLELAVPAYCRSILSVPCATGDAIRFMPLRSRLTRIAGIDINKTAIDFAKLRLRYPWLDRLNQLLLGEFENYARTGNGGRAAQMVLDVATALGSGSFSVDDVVQQLRAAWCFGVHNAVIADYWLLFKGLAQLVRTGPPAHPLASLQQAVERPNVPEQLKALVAPVGSAATLDWQRNGRRRPAAQVTLDCGDFLKTQNGLFDCIFVFEAFLMFFASGKQVEFLQALLNHLDRPGRLVLTGIRNAGKLPTELIWAQGQLVSRGLQVRTGTFRPTGFGYTTESFCRPYPFIIAEQGA